MKLIEKLTNIQMELNVPKSRWNDFGKYPYRSCEDILAAVKPFLKREGLTMFMTDAIEAIGGRVYAKASAHLQDDEDTLIACGWAREEEKKKGMDGSQITGAASSYARKRALDGLFLNDDVKDSDGTNTHGKEVQRNKPKDESPERAKAMQLYGEHKKLDAGGADEIAKMLKEGQIDYKKAIKMFTTAIDNFKNTESEVSE